MQTSEMEFMAMTIREKLGDKKADIINEELTKIIDDNKEMNETITSKDSEITKLRDKNDTLQDTNSKLFQQIGVGVLPQTKPQPQEPPTDPKPFNFKTAFDEKGNFID